MTNQEFNELYDQTVQQEVSYNSKYNGIQVGKLIHKVEDRHGNVHVFIDTLTHQEPVTALLDVF